MTVEYEEMDDQGISHGTTLGCPVCQLVCQECKAVVFFHWNKETNERLWEAKLCYTCDFWMARVPFAAHPNSVRINRNHYIIGNDEPHNRHARGFGGAKFTIKFHDGRIVETTNLWHQGKIPPRFLDLLPDNAVFLKAPMR